MNCSTLRATCRVDARDGDGSCARLCPSGGGSQSELQADCGGGGRVQRRRWRRKICGHKMPGRAHHRLRALMACTPRIGCTNGVIATELQCSGVTATETECSGVTATGEVRW